MATAGRSPLPAYLATHVAVLVGAVLVLFREKLLPERFFYDGDHIQQVALGHAFSYGDASYVNVAEAYRVLGLADKPALAALLGYVLFVVAVLLAARGIDLDARWRIAVVPVCVLIGAVYLGFYSKDVYVLPVVVLLLAGGRRRSVDIVLTLLMLLYAGLFRGYWVIVAAFFVGFRIVLQRVRSPLLLLALAAAAAVAGAIAVTLALGVSPDGVRGQINEYRVGTDDATTIIQPYVPLAEPVGGIVNAVITLLFLIVPLPLAALGGAYYLGLALVIAALWGFAGAAALRALRQGRIATDPRYARALALLLAFVVTQALFEPDYGSALRHLSPLLPALLLVACTSPSSAAPELVEQAPLPRRPSRARPRRIRLRARTP